MSDDPKIAPRVEEIKKSLYSTDAPIVEASWSDISYLLQRLAEAEKEISALRADISRLTKERDRYELALEKIKAHTIHHAAGGQNIVAVYCLEIAKAALQAQEPKCVHDKGAYWVRSYQELAGTCLKKANPDCPYCSAQEGPKEAVDVEAELRMEIWLNHGHETPALYGDDGEMQCNHFECVKDFKREPIATLVKHVSNIRLVNMARHNSALQKKNKHSTEGPRT